MRFLEYIALRVEKFGTKEQLRYRLLEDGIYEYDTYLAINMTLSFKNAKFIFLHHSNGKYYYKDIE